ncbi:equilibrative nucleobase transporter 1 isoform X3 [Hippoglossus stenolepis]|uniref:equilibrative nucleobase transporter 1 isoform X3 n=1 Tax=Hippoglossus stenolepis TaxID=195615 RepID=UPI001FAFADB9|nr:equilibrative nucleobase transporter 1 isoform X3 [Hippoglossus stenolepis]
MLRIQGGEVKLQHWLTLLSGLVESLFFTGIAYGWASLVFVLKNDGYFAAYCTNATRDEDYAVYTDCSGQDEHFSQVMSVASIATTILRFPIGYVYDRCGTAVTRIVAMSLYTTGTLLITLSNAETSVLLYPGLSSLIVAGTMLYITNAQVGNLFHSYRSTTITIYNGAFEASAAVCLIVKLLYERGVSLQTSFLFLTLCNIIHCVRTIFLMPRRHIPYPLPETYTYGVSCTVQKRKRRQEENDTVQKFKEGDAEKTEKDEKDELTSPQHRSSYGVVNEWSVTTPTHFPSSSCAGCCFVPSAASSWTDTSTDLWLQEKQVERQICVLPLSPSSSAACCVFSSVCVSPVLSSCCSMSPSSCRSPAAPSSTDSTKPSSALPSLRFTLGRCPEWQCLYQLWCCFSSFLCYTSSKISCTVTRSIFHFLSFFKVNIGVTVVSLLTFIHPVHVSLYCRELAKQRKNSQLTRQSLRSSDQVALVSLHRV